MSETKKFNRSKFKDATNADELKAADKAVENATKTGNKNYAGFLDIEQGMNKFLLYPSHEKIMQILPENEGKEIENKPFIVPMQKWWFEIEVESKDDFGNVIKDQKGRSIMKMAKKAIFDARVHSKVKKDIVDFYITVLTEMLKDEYGHGKEAEPIIREKLLVVYGSYQKRVQGIIGKPGWVMYVDKLIGDQKIFGRIEIGKAVKMRINELIAVEEANQPIGSESNNPFTDIDDRRALTIKYDKEAKDARLYYTTEIDTTNVNKVLVTYPLTDQELEEFLKFPSLSSMYEDIYSKKDFELAVKGLSIFDDKHEFGVFQNQKFIDACEEYSELYPDAKEEESSDEQGETESDENIDQFEMMDRNDMKKFSRENKTGIVVHTKLSDEDLKSQLREWYAKNNEVEEEIEEELEPEPEIEEEVEETEEEVAEVPGSSDLTGDIEAKQKVERKAATGKSKASSKIAEAREKAKSKAKS